MLQIAQILIYIKIPLDFCSVYFSPPLMAEEKTQLHQNVLTPEEEEKEGKLAKVVFSYCLEKRCKKYAESVYGGQV